MNLDFIVIILSRALTAGTPLLFGTVGEVFTERSGIMNLGIEGMMSVGALSAFVVTFYTNNPWLGLAAGALGGMLLSLLHAFIVITIKASQVISGLALSMFGIGLTGLLGKPFIGLQLKVKWVSLSWGFLSKLPVIGPVFFSRDILFYISVICTVFIWFFLYRSRAGILVRSCGENPLAVKSMGYSPASIQYRSVMAGGFLCGMGGAYLSLVYNPTWIEGVVGGRGWIVVALTIFASWNPIKAFIGAYLFGGVYVLQYLLQKYHISPNLLMMMPYFITIFVLWVGSLSNQKRASSCPAALGDSVLEEP